MTVLSVGQPYPGAIPGTNGAVADLLRGDSTLLIFLDGRSKIDRWLQHSTDELAAMTTMRMMGK